MIINPSPLHLQYADFSSSKELALANIEKRIQRSMKRVRFFPHVLAREVLHVNDYSEDEAALVWYTPYEFALMRKERKEIIALIQSGEYPGDDAHRCARGLEKESRNGSIERRNTKRSGRLAVLEEQSIQKQRDVFDPQSIAMAYISATQQCLERAYAMAMFDAVEVLRVTPRTTSRKDARAVPYKVGALLRFFRKRNSQ